jgi:hypothetical protein
MREWKIDDETDGAKKQEEEGYWQWQGEEGYFLEGMVPGEK